MIRCLSRANCIGRLFGCVALITMATELSYAASPNVVIILADDMGYGDPGCYNPSSKCPTPNIDKLSAGGMRFTDAHAAGAWCTPSRYGLLTGRYAFRTDLAWQKQPVIEEGVRTVADTLRDAGYATAMVGKWHLGFEEADKFDYQSELYGGPCDRGFDSYYGLPASLDIPDYFWIHDRSVPVPPTISIPDSNSEGWSPIQARYWRGGLRGEDFVMEEVLDKIADVASGKIRELANAARPFFLYVPLTSPHTPWLPGDEYQAADEAGMYSQFVNHTDAVVGKVLTSLEQAELSKDTIVIFASDNGPVWYRSDTERFGHDSMGGLRGMKGDVWEAGHRVPFVVRWPGNIAAGSVSDQLISFVDVHATLAEFVGAELPKSAVDSLSFANHWTGKSDDTVRSELVCFQSPIAIRLGNWKLITRPGSSGFLAHDPVGRSAFLQADELNPNEEAAGDVPQGQLYDLANDPGETRNLSNDRPEIVKQLRDQLRRYEQ